MRSEDIALISTQQSQLVKSHQNDSNILTPNDSQYDSPVEKEKPFRDALSPVNKNVQNLLQFFQSNLVLRSFVSEIKEVELSWEDFDDEEEVLVLLQELLKISKVTALRITKMVRKERAKLNTLQKYQ